MAEINIKTDIKGLVKEFDAVRAKQIPYAIRLTVNKLAENSKKNMEMKEISKLDRPTRYTQNMMRVQYANRINLISTIKVKDSATVTKRGMYGPDQVLGHLFKGGTRRGKGFEGLMRQKGILPEGMFAVPGEGATLDAHGNLSRGLIVQLLAYFNAFQESGFRANMSDKNKSAFERRYMRKHHKSAQSFNFFLVKKDGTSTLHPGIWARVGFGVGKSIKPILMFVGSTNYRQYFDLPKIVERVVDRDLEFEFGKAFAQAEATAR